MLGAGLQHGVDTHYRHGYQNFSLPRSCTRCSPGVALTRPACSAKTKQSEQLRAAALDEVPIKSQPSQAGAGAFSWSKNWYPVAAVEDTDPARPHPVTLLGRKLVLWRGAEQAWRCFDDACPHRKVPLSEGRIEESDGTLMCGYHGWRFGPNGKPTYIPQISAIDKEAEANACLSPRACAKVHPTQVHQGLIFVWGESGPSAEHESAASAIHGSELLDELGGEAAVWVGLEIPNILSTSAKQALLTQPVITNGLCSECSVCCKLENSFDQSHVPFAHPGFGGQGRGGEKEGYYRTLSVKTDLPKEQGCEFDAEFSGDGRGTVTISTTFIPPCLLRIQRPDSRQPTNNLWLYAVPRTPDSVRLIISSGGRGRLPWYWTLAMKLHSFFYHLNRAGKHRLLNRVGDGDQVFVGGQSKEMAPRGSTQQDRIQRWSYYLPGSNDRGVALWLKWLTTEGQGGVDYPHGASAARDSVWDAAGKLDRRRLLDRYSQHTAHCKSCSTVLSVTRTAQKLSLTAVAVSLLAAAAMLVQGVRLLSMSVGIVAITAAAATWLYTQLREYEKCFIYEGWHNQDH